jgi:hypothetical protein
MEQTQGQIGWSPQVFASKIAIWIADRGASRLELLYARVALISGLRERRHRKLRPDTHPVYCDEW